MRDRRVDTGADVPEWFTAALDHTPGHGRIDAAGTDIAYREWGPLETGGRSAPLLLLHGVAGHSGWWDHIGPRLADRRRVVAMDLSGHGDSGRRDSYDLDGWSDEVLGLADALGLRRPYLVGHSLGGLIGMRVAQRAGQDLAGIVLVESVIEDRAIQVDGDPRFFRSGTSRVHRDRAVALARWRPLPDGGDIPDFLVRHVAAGSLRKVDGGWSWKFDPRIFRCDGLHQDAIVPVRCRVALFRGETGSVTTTAQKRVASALGGRALDMTVPGAGHNIPLETPRALTLALTTLSAAWDQEL
ncbi:alpha/beta hydrolase [Nocardia sp. NPDC050799]|uniref:alpha/beta fold hydrolase n=1 Tax=Nocardia sp. NPDC050799 TaxID=3154842 RepID=UPI0034091E97